MYVRKYVRMYPIMHFSRRRMWVYAEACMQWSLPSNIWGGDTYERNIDGIYILVGPSKIQVSHPYTHAPRMRGIEMDRTS
jgi:hypothetical protein